jgi:hypothetical protein
VLLGLNQHIQEYFTDELDFCMALDFNYDPSAEKRTIFGEAEYQPPHGSLEDGERTCPASLESPNRERS